MNLQATNFQNCERGVHMSNNVSPFTLSHVHARSQGLCLCVLYSAGLCRVQVQELISSPGSPEARGKAAVM